MVSSSDVSRENGVVLEYDYRTDGRCCHGLFRPVGARYPGARTHSSAVTGFTAFPPRLTGQPIFYQVLDEHYAAQIARDWNTRDPQSEYVGYVLRFRVRAEFLARYAVHD